MVVFSPTEFSGASWLHGSCAVVRLDGELDCANEGLARAEIEIALERGGTELLLDLRGLTFLDLRGVHVLLDARTACREQQRRLLLVPPPDRVQRIFALCRVERRFEFVAPGAHPAALAA